MWTPIPPASGVALLKRLESCKLESYLDINKIPTIGYGLTKGVKLGDVCTQAQADAWLTEDCAWAWLAVQKHVGVPLNDNQAGALLSFVYNLGEPRFETTTALKVLNCGKYSAVPAAMLEWDKKKAPDGSMVVSNGLENRRESEIQLWNQPVA